MKITLPRFLSVALLISSPLIVFAQTVTNIPSLFTYALDILNGYVVPIIFAIAFIFFLFNVYRYFIQNGGNAEKVQEGQKFVLWSIIGFVVMFSIWGIINLFINTLGFGTAAQPAFPTFNGGTSGSGITPGSNSIFDFFGGGSGSTGVGSTGSTGTGNLPVGSTFTDNGTTYTVTGPNTTSQVNHGCATGFSPSGLFCVLSSTFNTAPPVNAAAGSVSAGGNCSSNDQCKSGLSCNSDGQCAATPQNGAVPVGGSCAGNEYACQNGDVCNTNNNLCEAVPADGTVGQNGSCLGNENACQDGFTCDTANTDTCVPISGNGTVGQGGSCLNNPNACTDGLTCDDNTDTCQPDSTVNNSVSACEDGVDPGPSGCYTCPDGSTAGDANNCPAITSGN